LANSVPDGRVQRQLILAAHECSSATYQVCACPINALRTQHDRRFAPYISTNCEAVIKFFLGFHLTLALAGATSWCDH
jgi:hypothetical protein